VTANNEIILIPRIGDHEVELGTLDDYPIKLAKLKMFYLHGLNKIGWGDYKSISLKFKNQVVCTKK
jgi:cell division protein FtsQ